MPHPMRAAAEWEAAQVMRHTEAMIGPIAAEMVRHHTDALVEMVRQLERQGDVMADLLHDAIGMSCEPEARQSTPARHQGCA